MPILAKKKCEHCISEIHRFGKWFFLCIKYKKVAWNSLLAISLRLKCYVFVRIKYILKGQETSESRKYIFQKWTNICLWDFLTVSKSSWNRPWSFRFHKIFLKKSMKIVVHNCSENTGAKVWILLLKLFESTLYMLVQNLFELTLEKDAFQS